MADLKISQLSAVTTLDGTEEFVLNDSGTSKKITADDLGASLGISQQYLGYNTVGASWQTPTTNRMYAKKITVPVDGLISSIDAYIKGNGSNVGSIGWGIWEDDAGNACPGNILASGRAWGDTLYVSTTGRWYSMASSTWVTAADYWIGWGTWDGTNLDAMQVAYDSGSDLYFDAGGAWFRDWTAASDVDSGRKYSIRANLIS